MIFEAHSCNLRWLLYTWLAVWLSGNALASINVVVLRQTRLVPGWDRLWTGKTFRYLTSQLGQLSLSSLRGRWIEYQPAQLEWRQGGHLCLVAGNTVWSHWQVASRSFEVNFTKNYMLLFLYVRFLAFSRQSHWRPEMFSTGNRSITYNKCCMHSKTWLHSLYSRRWHILHLFCIALLAWNTTEYWIVIS